MKYLLLSLFLLTPALQAACPSQATAQQEMLTLVNQFRIQGGVCGSTKYAPSMPITLNSYLIKSASGHSNSMATYNYFSHTGRDGTSSTDRIKATGYLTGARSWATGENIGAGTQRNNAKMQFDAWKASSGHCANMLTAKFTHLGIACAYNAKSQYTHYWTMNLGKGGKQ